VVEQLRGKVPMTGFYTEEVKEGGRRRGFRGVTLDGRTFTLADRELEGPYRVGPYTVSLEGLESIGLDALRPRPDTQLIVLDEVGKMECFSAAFRARVEELLAGDTPLLASVASIGVGFVKRVRNDPRIDLLRVRPASRDGMVGEILRRLGAQTAASPSSSSRP
jgi:nucleoside-triphosphatase